MQVEVQPPKGDFVLLTERSKMRYLDQCTFIQMLQEAWKNCILVSGMPLDQLLPTVLHRNVTREAHAVKAVKEASIRFLDMKVSKRGYMRRIKETMQAIQEITWPYKKKKTEPGA